MSSSIDAFRIKEIMEMLPHRYPFLLVDRVVEYVQDSHIDAYKNVTMNEPFFQGHFPGLPIMPGVLMLEALAQTGGIYVMQTPGLDIANSVFMFTSMDKVKFRKPVIPGDRMDLHMEGFRRKLNMWKMNGVASVEGEVVAQGTFSAALVGKESM